MKDNKHLKEWKKVFNFFKLKFKEKKMLENLDMHEDNQNKEFILEMEKKRELERQELIAKMPKKDYKPIDDIEYNLQYFLLFNPRIKGDTAYDCFTTMKTVCNNIYVNPNEEKFRKVKYLNPGFQNKVGIHPAPMKVLEIIGFVPENELLVYRGSDNVLLKNTLDLLDKYIQKA